MTDLTDQERGILDLEKLWFRYVGNKEAAIRERFDMTSTRYNQILNALIDTEAAMKYAPGTVKGLQRRRDKRRRGRGLNGMG